MSKVYNIVKGWGNLIKQEIGILDKPTEKMSAERLSICNKCFIRSGNMCSSSRRGKNLKTGQMSYGCGCVLIAKATVKEANCPLHKW